MATGVSRKKWKGNGAASVAAFPPDSTNGSIRLTYLQKKSETEIIHHKPSRLTPLWPPLNSPGLPAENRLYYADNLDVLASLKSEPEICGGVQLVYIDPPFSTNSVFQSRKQVDAYVDLLAGAEYLEFLRRRLVFLREILAPSGSIYLHLDSNMVFLVKVVMDEVFGAGKFRSCITRKKCNPKNYTRKSYGNVSDYILFYTKSDDYVWHRPVDKWTPDRAAKEYQCVEKETGRRYKKVPVHAPGVRHGATGTAWREMLPPPGKHWQYTPDRLDEMDARGEIYWSPTGNPRRKVYLDQSQGIPVQDIWLEFRDAHNQNIRITGYPTEKNPDLLRRIILASSNPGDLVLDCFSGSGTTLAVASSLHRRWIGVDNSSEAISTTIQRFLKGTSPMGDYVSLRNGNGSKQQDQATLPLFDSLESSTADALPPAHQAITDFALLTDTQRGRETESAFATALHSLTQKRSTIVREARAEYRADQWVIDAEKWLAKKDRNLASLIRQYGHCRIHRKPGGFQPLLEAIVNQQLSDKAATRICERVAALNHGKPFSAKSLNRVEDADLRTAGMSKRKIACLRSLAQRIDSGILSFQRLGHLEDDEILQELTQVKGIGSWTAEMYLIFVLARPDVFPSADAALLGAMKQVYGLDTEGLKETATKIAAGWRPYRTVASWYLWKHASSSRVG